MKSNKPVVALTLGDAAGIGSELVAKLLIQANLSLQAHIVLVADKWQWEEGQRLAGVHVPLTSINDLSKAKEHDLSLFEVNTLDEQDKSFGQVSAACGKSTIDVLTLCMEAALAGQVQAITFAPLNKQAMKLGGLKYEDELHFFADYLGVKSYFCEFNTLGSLWTSRISSHIPLKEAHKYITAERIQDATILIYQNLQRAGVKTPRVVVAAFNPHAGDGGTCGREEVEIIQPAIAALVQQGYKIDGPFPADTIFIRAQKGEVDAVVTMYHDQGQIALKLLGFSQGVTVQGGLPIPITTPAHGTAFDIAGQSVANVNPMRNAFDIACRMGQSFL